MPLSTYQNDYQPPNAYKLFGEGKWPENEAKNCTVERAKRPTPKCVLKTKKINAPPLQLINPAIYLNKLTPKQIRIIAESSRMNCYKNQSNRFILTLRKLYPELYDYLLHLTVEELQRTLLRTRMYTTYQSDYNDATEYPNGPCSVLDAKPDDCAQILAREMLNELGMCHPLRECAMKRLAEDTENFVDPTPCERSFRRRKTMGDAAVFKGATSGAYWPPREEVRRYNYSEYHDKISKTGCSIMHNNIHDHSNCGSGGKRCRHPLNNQHCVHLR